MVSQVDSLSRTVRELRHRIRTPMSVPGLGRLERSVGLSPDETRQIIRFYEAACALRDGDTKQGLNRLDRVREMANEMDELDRLFGEAVD